MQMSSSNEIDRHFLDEYNSQEAIRKYSSQTAGHGVNYLIEHDYARVYDRAIEICRRTSQAPLRVLEFGCGAGMNLIGLVSRLERRGTPVRQAIGTDFSQTLIAEARREGIGVDQQVQCLAVHVAAAAGGIDVDQPDAGALRARVDAEDAGHCQAAASRSAFE